MVAVKKMMVVLVVVGLFIVASVNADMLYLRDGWDPVNNVADPNGYAGTKDDTSMDNDYGIGTYAGQDYLFFAAVPRKSAAIVDFDLSGFPQLNGATVNSATLVMTFSYAPWFNGTTAVIRECDKNWDEDKVGYYKYTYGSESGLWSGWESSPAMQMSGPNIDTVTLPAKNDAQGRTGQTVSFDVTSVVKGWIEDGNNQKGFSISQETKALNNNTYWAGKAYATVSYRPMLILDYTPVPEPATIGLLLFGIIGFIRRK